MYRRNHSNPLRDIAAVAAAFVTLLLLGTGIATAQEEVPVVDNGLRGSMRSSPTLTEKAVAGTEGPEEAMFYRPVSMFFNERGDLYVVDFGNKSVQIYDRDGGFIQRFGGEGQGPREFRMPAGGYTSWDDEIVIDDPGNGRRSYFSLDGEFLRSEALGPVYMGGTPQKTTEGNYARVTRGGMIMVSRGGGGGGIEEPASLIEIIDGEGNVVGKMGTQKEHENRMISMLLNSVLMDYLPSGHLVVAFINANEIHMYNLSTGELERIFTRRLAFNPKEPDMRVVTSETQSEGGRVEQRMEVRPDTDPITRGIAVDPEGRIWVVTRLISQEAADEKELDGEFDGIARIEIFSSEGELLTTIPLDISPSMIRFDPFGDLWLLDTSAAMAAYRYEVKWP